MITIPGFNDTPKLKIEREISNIENLLECGYGRTNKPLSQHRRKELEKRLIELKQMDVEDHPGPWNTCDGCIKAQDCHAGNFRPRVVESRSDLSSFCISKQLQ